MGRDLFLKTNHKYFPYCQHCGKKLKLKQAVKDHLTPVTLGGSDDWDNCVISCIPCNTKKGNNIIEKPKYGPTWDKNQINRTVSLDPNKLKENYQLKCKERLIFEGPIEKCRIERTILKSKGFDCRIFNKKGEEVD